MKSIGKILLTLLFFYLLIYIFPFPLNYIPFGVGQFIAEQITQFWQWTTTIFYESLFGISYELNFSERGSGDTLYNYLLIPVQIFVALAIMIIWFVFDWQSNNKELMMSWFILLLRYYLAFTMFSYGFSKLFYIQFPELNLMNLTRTFGDSSPMALLWRFMGYSETYSIFTGAAEILGGGLLLFRRTKILGSLLTFAIMVNVFMLNMSFDVPVKLYSFHLCIITLIILFPDFSNLFRLFILNKPTVPLPINEYFGKKLYNWISYGLKVLLLSYVLYGTVSNKLDSQKRYGKRASKNSLYGIYNISHFIKNGDTLPPLFNDSIRWKQLIIDKNNSLLVMMDDSRIPMVHIIDSTNKILKLRPYLEKYNDYDLSYDIRDSIFNLTLINNSDSIHISTKKMEREDFFLIKRGFHWINEYPMQR